jgi:tripartite-type tricarboxylate transporter receptor subunit TctC
MRRREDGVSLGTLLRTCLAAAAILFTGYELAAPAPAQAAENFYAGKTVIFLVGGSAGGGYDTTARLIARFLANHIPGSPTIAVEDMPGAGGLVAANNLYNNAPRDGTEIGLLENGAPLAPLFGMKEARYDPTKFNWLGTPSVETALVLVWHTVPVNSVNDLRTRVTTMGGSGLTSTQAFYARLLNATLGTKMKVVNGYQGLADSFLAMQRGEIDGTPTVFYSSLVSTRPNWLPDHLAKAIVQYGGAKIPALANAPFAPDLVHNPDDKLLMQAAFAPLALGRPMMMPPGVPADRVSIMRKAIDATLRDPAFLAEAEKLGPIANAPRTGAQLEQVVDQAYAAPSRVVARLRRLENPTSE